jgi:hypothetical protein
LRFSGAHRDQRRSAWSVEPARAQRREAVGPRTAAHLLTERLRLDAVVPDDLDEHFALMSDHGVGVLAGNVWDAFAGREVRPARRRSWLIFLGVAVAAYVTATAIGRYPDPDAVRLVHADRPLPDDILARVTALA